MAKDDKLSLPQYKTRQESEQTLQLSRTSSADQRRGFNSNFFFGIRVKGQYF